MSFCLVGYEFFCHQAVSLENVKDHGHQKEREIYSILRKKLRLIFRGAEGLGPWGGYSPENPSTRDA